MDGLIKGLMDVALDHLGQKDDESRDERSRSSWAQVVSGEEQGNDDNRQSSNRRQGYNRTNQWESQSEGRRNEEWQTEGSRPSRRPQNAVNEGYARNEGGEQHDYSRNQWNRKEGGEETNDGWETVGKRHPKQQHKIHMDQWNGYKRPASEQEYSNEVEDSTRIGPSKEELADLSQACNRLWEFDTNRLVPGKDYRIDCGEGKKVYEKEDMAQGSLFSSLSEDVFKRPTFSRFCSLLDNYNPNQGSKEVVTSEERQEQAAFIEEISRTAPIKYLHKYLASKGIVSENYQDFKRILTSLWFDLYGRGGTFSSSSAFEHVFVGEIKQRGEQEVSGFHNWLQNAEMQGGHLLAVTERDSTFSAVYSASSFLNLTKPDSPDSESQVLTIQFEWNGVLKSVSSTLVGVSPEFEIALYTLCFYVGGEDNYVELGPYPVNIKCYRLGDRIGSVFPIAEC
ncbi:unnamed protein product [Dovyalis caffra]|uniref:EndoU domain-containing protein n=1 Tax=Dovyalis caffra TaxID=77055 RepID=A0AAV1STW5_9ROSI|nr:unnamed protein product [Dovyalis caffra]